MGAEDEAHMILGAFLEKTGFLYDEVYPALLPVLTTRAIGVLFDAENDQSFNDYRTPAQDLLARCLSRDPAQFAPTS